MKIRFRNRYRKLGIFDINNEKITDGDFLRGVKKSGIPPFENDEYVTEGKVAYHKACYFLGNHPLFEFETLEKIK